MVLTGVEDDIWEEHSLRKKCQVQNNHEIRITENRRKNAEKESSYPMKGESLV